MNKKIKPPKTKEFSTFIKRFKKEFKRNPKPEEAWSFCEGFIVAVEQVLKQRNKKK